MAEAVGKSRSYIANTVRLLNLDKEIMDYIIKGEITRGHGRALLSIANKEERIKAAEDIVNNKTNVREIEKMVKKENKKTKKEIKKGPFQREIEENLMSALGTRVKLTTKKNGGKIEIEFYSHEDLDRIIEIITK